MHMNIRVNIIETLASFRSGNTKILEIRSFGSCFHKCYSANYLQNYLIHISQSRAYIF